MISPHPGEITNLLRQIERGNVEAHDQLARLVRTSLKRIAANRLRRERPDHLYQTSDLVQEAYLRLFRIKNLQWEGRQHFFRIAARQMRHILVEYARRQRPEDRGQVGFGDIPGLQLSANPGVLSVHLLLNDLAKIDERRALIVELRFFGGYKIEEIAEITGISVATVKRHWAAAKTFIKLQLGATGAPDSCGHDAAHRSTFID